MKRFPQTIAAIAACCLFMLTLGESRADSYKIDPSHTSVIFGVSHFSYSYTYGRFNKVQGNFVWDNANTSASKFVVAISTASIDTNDAQRDGHLRNADFFNAKQFPQIIFQSTSISPARQNNKAGNMYDVVGNLTIHGVTKQVTLPMKKLGEGLGPYGKYRCGFFCQTTLKRSDYGMTNMLPNVGDQIALTISFEGLRQGAAGQGSASKVGAPSKGSDHKGSDHKGSDHKGSDHKSSDHQGSDHKGSDHK